MEPSRKLPSVPKRLLKEKRPVTVTAAKPGQIVCWDVTFLPHVFTGSRFAACVFVDLYSRQIVGFKGKVLLGLVRCGDSTGGGGVGCLFHQGSV